jgi:hypothetical protein
MNYFPLQFGEGQGFETLWDYCSENFEFAFFYLLKWRGNVFPASGSGSGIAGIEGMNPTLDMWRAKFGRCCSEKIWMDGSRFIF